MVKHLPQTKRPLPVHRAGAFLRSEAWQSGLLHRAYPSADVWASNPLTASREFEPHRFHHLTSGAEAVAAATAPDHQPRDLAPKRTTVLANIHLAGCIFQNRSGLLPQVTDLARHQYPVSRQAN
jgi:hypothetical protein